MKNVLWRYFALEKIVQVSWPVRQNAFVGNRDNFACILVDTDTLISLIKYKRQISSELLRWTNHSKLTTVKWSITLSLIWRSRNNFLLLTHTKNFSVTLWLFNYIDEISVLSQRIFERTHFFSSRSQ